MADGSVLLAAKTGRIPCEVLGCRRTAPAVKYAPDTLIICGQCWRLGSKRNRARFALAKRKMRSPKVVSAAPWVLDRWRDISNEAWEAVLVAASEARAGI